MKRDLLNRTLFVLIAFFACSLTTQAQLLMEENFEYEAGGLYQKGEWVKYGTHANNPIKITNQSLIYPGYIDTATGKAIELICGATATTTDEDLCKKFDSDIVVNNGTIYVSALMNFKDIENAVNGNNYFFGLVEKKGNTFADNYAGKEYARLHAKKINDDEFKLGILRYTGTEANIAYTTETYSFNVTYLVVLKYEITGETAFGSKDDIVSLFVNPVIGITEPMASAIYNGTTGADIDVETTGFYGIELKQNHTATKNVPNVLIGNIRIARTYAELFKLTPSVQPEITCDPAPFYFGYWGRVYAGETYTQDIIIKGKNLKGDITVGGMASGEITASATTISKAEAEAEDGYALTLTFNPIKEGDGEDTIILSSEGLKENVIIETAWATTVIKEVPDLETLWKEDFSKFGVYKITGEVTISHKQVANDQTYYYLQDANKGMYILDGYGNIEDVNLKAGTKIKNLTGQVQNSWGGYIMPISGIKLYDIVSQDNTIAPKLVTLSELETNAAQYKDMLVKVNNVELGWMKESNFEPVAPGDVFTDDAANRTYIKDADGKTVSIRIFPETDIIGAPTPATAHITGLSTSAAGNLIAPRSLADIEKLTDPVSIKDNKDQSLSVFTAKGTIRIDGAGVRKVELYDITGNKVAETATQELNGLVPALYLVKVTTTEGTVVKKIYIK